MDLDRDRPRAWNLELAYYPAGDLSWAFRLEGSRELEDAPKWQASVAGLWRVRKNIFLNFEYLHGKFERSLGTNKFGREIKTVDQIGALLSIEF